jgi:hypothetical protein
VILEIHDDAVAVGDSLLGRVEISYDYQAEREVQELAAHRPDATAFLLLDGLGERAAWERQGGAVTLVRRSDRFGGDWQLGQAVNRNP